MADRAIHPLLGDISESPDTLAGSSFAMRCSQADGVEAMKIPMVQDRGVGGDTLRRATWILKQTDALSPSAGDNYLQD